MIATNHFLKFLLKFVLGPFCRAKLYLVCYTYLIKRKKHPIFEVPIVKTEPIIELPVAKEKPNNEFPIVKQKPKKNFGKANEQPEKKNISVFIRNHFKK